MERMTKYPDHNSLVVSIGEAIEEYMSRHNGEKPAYIVASLTAYNSIISDKNVRVKKENFLGGDISCYLYFRNPCRNDNGTRLPHTPSGT